MAETERIVALQAIFDLLATALKALGILLLMGLALMALAYPDSVTTRLQKWKVDQVEFGGIKFVLAKDTIKSANSVLRAADALGEVEATLAAESPTASRRVLLAVDEVRSALDSQGATLKQVADNIGLVQRIPDQGWLYVGYFTESGALARAYSRIGSPAGIHWSAGQAGNAKGGGRIDEIVLRFDAPVTSDGDNCARPDVADYRPPDPDSPDVEYAIIRASDVPVKVISTVACPAAARGTQVYAKVVVPKQRVRFAKLSALKT